MKTYRDWAPTSVDRKGLDISIDPDWLVCPCVQTRDSDALDRSNYDAQFLALGESDDVAYERVGHWAVGWLEFAVVRPGSKAARVAESLEERLSDYPILDEELFALHEDADESGNEAVGGWS